MNNTRMLRRQTWLSIAAFVGILVVPAMAGLEIDDFEGTPSGGFNNPVFRHAPGPDEFYGYEPVMWGFDAGSWISPTHSLHLTPATDYITFNLNAGEYVDYAQVWMRRVGMGDPATFHVLGVDETGRPLEYTETTAVGNEDWVFVDTLGAGFAEITEIRLTGTTKVMFDDVGVGVVPEPATLGLLGLGFLGLTWSRRRRPAG